MSATWAARGGHPLAASTRARGWPRLWPAVSLAVGLHFVLLASRPGGLVPSHVDPGAVIAFSVRMLRAPTPVPLSAETTSAVPSRSSARSLATTESSPVDRALPATRNASPAPAEAHAHTLGAAAERASSDARDAPQAPTPNAGGSSLPAAPDYMLGARLDPGPRPLEDIDPDYPDPYLREGTVVLRLLISDTGQVDNVAVVRSQPPGVFDAAALDAFGKAKFAPGRAAGIPVKSQITVEVRFMPINRGAGVSGRTY
jgi:periplasmic protein TonB